METRYNFSWSKAKEIDGNSELVQKEAIAMKAAFDKQGNTAHSLEMSANYANAMRLERVFYHQLVPAYKLLK